MRAFVYLVRLGDTNYFKVGISTNLGERLNALQTAAPVELVVIRAVEQENALDMERDIHAALKSNRVRNEWFLCDLDDIARVFDDYNAMGLIDSALGTSPAYQRTPRVRLVVKHSRHDLVVVNGISYPSIQAAADAHGITRQAMSKKIKKEAS